MSPRPRNAKNKGLPTNLYMDARRGSYRYRRPDDGTWHGMGTDKAEAIRAAKQLNALLTARSDLISKVMGDKISMQDFIEIFRSEILPHRELAKATLDLYAVRFRQINAALGVRAVDEITVRQVSELLDGLTPRASNQSRALLIDIFNHACAKGLCPDNPASVTISRIERKERKRHTVEGIKAIREQAPAWLQNAIDLALITAQRRADILNMRFDDISGGYLHVIQQKTAKATDAAWIRFKLTPELAAVIERCRDDVLSPFLIHRRPQRLKQKQQQNKEHWTKIEDRYLTRAFKEARDAAGCYAEWSDAEQPGFHEVRALSLHLYKKAGRDGQKIAGHATEEMTRNYQRDHEEIVWADAVPDLDIASITG